MNEIIIQWKIFMKFWNEGDKNTVEFDGKKRKIKPSFYDFMEWLSK